MTHLKVCQRSYIVTHENPIPENKDFRIRVVVLWSLFLHLAMGGSVPGTVPTVVEDEVSAVVPEFRLEPNELELIRRAQPFTPFDKVGRRFAIIGFEGGTFEVWGYPLKILRSCEFSFLLGNSTEKIKGKEIARWISVKPEATTISFTHQDFVVRAIFIAPVEEPGAIILLDVNTTKPVSVVVSFLPVMQPMWPAGIGGQYSYWDHNLKAYVISESTHRNVGYIGSPAASGISYTPAHMLSDVPMEFRIDIRPEEVDGMYVPVVLAGGHGKPEEYRNTYLRLARDPESYYRANLEHYGALRRNTLQVKTPVEKVNLAFEWAKVSYDNLVVTNPALGTGLVAGLANSGTSGRPGFGWYFGGDAFINSLSLDSYGAYPTVRDALMFTQKWQRDDGKMAHELSQSAGVYIDWFGEYHYGYIHGDTTPWYLVAAGDYYRWTGDLEFVQKSWPSLKKAYEWCLSTDQNGDGLMDNNRAGLGALEFGPLTGILTDVYLAEVWVKAVGSMEILAAVVGDAVLASECRKQFEVASKALNRQFWDKKSGLLSYAFNMEGERVPELTPWSAPGMMWNLFDTEKSRATLTRINSAEVTTDWGIRCLSNKSDFFEPLNYNYGAVWPFITSFVSTSQFRHHFAEAGLASLMSTVWHTFDNSLGSVTELFSGAINVWPAEGVHHQGFASAGAVLPLVRGLLGLEVNAPEKTIVFAPHLPADWKELHVSNIKVGSTVVNLEYTRSHGAINLSSEISEAGTVSLTFSPAFQTGNVKQVLVNGKEASFDIEETRHDFHVTVTAEISNTVDIHIEYEPSFEIVFPVFETRTGDPNAGLKVIEQKRGKRGLEFVLEGLSGGTYLLKAVNPESIKNVNGAELRGGTIELLFPELQTGEFVRQTLVIEGKR